MRTAIECEPLGVHRVSSNDCEPVLIPWLNRVFTQASVNHGKPVNVMSDCQTATQSLLVTADQINSQQIDCMGGFFAMMMAELGENNAL